MTGAAPSGVGRTALGVARVRASEHRRPGRLFDDPLAERFLSAAPSLLVQRVSPSGDHEAVQSRFADNVVLRTRYFDDHLLDVCAQGCRQVVLLAAGLDTRAFRLDLPPDGRVFELDRDDVLTFKNRVLADSDAAPRCQRVTLAVDLRADWAVRLTAAGFDPLAPTAWLAEGLLVYLSSDEAERLLTTVGALSAAGSTLALERGTLGADQLRQARALPGMSAYTSLWRGGLDEDAETFLARHGWQVSVHERAAVAEGYGLAARASAGSFVTAVFRPTS